MSRWSALAGLMGAVLLAAACSDALNPEHRAPVAPAFSHTGTTGGIALDQQNGALGEAGSVLIKGFDPTNPHRGSTILATFYWVGSTNIIDSVTDHLTVTGFPRVGNKYTLVVTASALNGAESARFNIGAL